jgi:hypothetical protein
MVFPAEKCALIVFLRVLGLVSVKKCAVLPDFYIMPMVRLADERA